MDLEICRSILSEYKIHNADVTIRYDATVDDLIDVIEGNRYQLATLYVTHPDDFGSFRVYIPCLYCLNKIDQITVEELDILDRIPHYVMISAHLEWNLDELLAKMWDYLGLIRMYSFPLLAQLRLLATIYNLSVAQQNSYTKPRGQIPNYTAPIVLSAKNCTVEAFCYRIHNALIRQFK